MAGQLELLHENKQEGCGSGCSLPHWPHRQRKKKTFKSYNVEENFLPLNNSLQPLPGEGNKPALGCLGGTFAFACGISLPKPPVPGPDDLSSTLAQGFDSAA